MKNLGTGGSSMTAGTVFEPVIQHDYGVGTDYYVSSSTDWSENTGYGGTDYLVDGGTILFVYKATNATSTEYPIQLGGLSVYVDNISPNQTWGIQLEPGAPGQIPDDTFIPIETDNQWRMVTVTNSYTEAGGLATWTWTAFNNATQVFTDDIALGTSWSSSTDSGRASVLGTGDSMSFGSIMRFTYPLTSTNISAIKGYLETLYGTFGS
jgi:hypothetical protein